jgi:hypothetical protein
MQRIACCKRAASSMRNYVWRCFCVEQVACRRALPSPNVPAEAGLNGPTCKHIHLPKGPSCKDDASWLGAPLQDRRGLQLHAHPCWAFTMGWESQQAVNGPCRSACKQRWYTSGCAQAGSRRGMYRFRYTLRDFSLPDQALEADT